MHKYMRRGKKGQEIGFGAVGPEISEKGSIEQKKIVEGSKKGQMVADLA